MTTENTAADPQAGEASDKQPQPQAGTIPPTDPQAGESQKPSLSAADYERMIAELRKESASHRTKLKKFEDEEKARTDAQLTEQQKKDKQFADLQKAHDDAVRQHQEYKINAEVRLQAAQMGFADVADAIRLLDWSEITYGDDGAPNNVKDLLSKLLKAKPYLAGKPVQAAPTAGGATAPARSQSNAPSALTWETIGSMKPDEYAARHVEIQQWIAAHPHRFGQRR